MISRMINIIKKNLLILIIVIILASYLGIKALDENGWDGWGFGSAQVLMSSKYWAKDGFAKNYFLFIASPYSKLIHYLDEPEFRNRPIETLNGELARGRLYYTHYPPLYLVSFALMAKVGFSNRFAYRIFALIISLMGFLFFYWFIKLISNKTTALIASIYYGISVTFLNYADSIATQPLTIFFTFLILLLSILTGHNFENRKIYKRYNLAIWFLYLLLSLTSYDATFFVFAWLILYDAIILKKFLWRRWIFFALAPIVGFTLQIAQNVWYLGWHDMWQDFYNAYRVRQIGTFKNFILGIIAPFVSMTGIKTVYFLKKTIVALGSALLIIWIFRKLRSKINLDSKFFRIIFVLAGAVIIQPFFINITGWWPYQGVLTAPFWGLLIGTASIFIINTLKKKESNIYKTFYFWILTSIMLILWWAQFYGTFVYTKDWPNNRPDQKVIEFSKIITTTEPNSERVAFRIIPQNQTWKSQFATFNMEYYFGMPKIDFANSHDLLTDFWWLRKISEYPYYSFVIADKKAEIDNLYSEIKKTLLNSVSEIKNIQGQYLFTVDPK